MKKEDLSRPYEYYGECVNIVDGDTIDVTLDLGFHLSFSMRLRLHGLDAPEKRGHEREAGLEATRWLTEKILNEDIKIETYKDKTGKYGRMLATIYRPVYGIKDISSRWVNVNNEMILEGQAIQVNY